MSEKGGNRIRIVLRWIQIKDNKEAMWDDEGEFRFRSKVTTAGQTHETEFPKEGYWSISDHPRGATRSTRSTRCSSRVRSATA
jgi:hypothetical protein